MALSGGKTDWMERSERGAGSPMDAGEMSGQDLLGHSSVRGGAIAGVSDTNPQRQNDSLSYGAAGAGGRGAARRNPPELNEVDQAGGLSASGGLAGGARGHGGTSVSGAGAPVRRPDQDPPSSESSSRFDLDHPTSDIGDEANEERDRE